jgi:hypothetical protein
MECSRYSRKNGRNNVRIRKTKNGVQEWKIKRDVLITGERRVVEMNLLVWSAVCHFMILVLWNIALCGGQFNAFPSQEGTS